MRRTMRVLVFLGVGFLTACGSGGSAAAQPTIQAMATRTVSGVTNSSSTRGLLVTPILTGTASNGDSNVSPEAAPLVQRAKQELASRATVAADQIKVVSVTRVPWPSSALGCPQPDRMYSQIVTPGYRILLDAGGKTYEYHSDLTQRVIYCPNPSP